jgi:hypothetical protein
MSLVKEALIVPPERLAAWSEFVMAPGLAPRILTALERLLGALKGVEFLLIGGQAVFLHGHERSSKDLDVGVVTPLKGVVARLAAAGFVHVTGARVREPTTGIEVDVVKLPRCAIPSMKAPAMVQVGALEVPVVPLELLIALKVKLGRFQDEADVAGLLHAGRTPDRARLQELLRGLGEDISGYDRLVERARRERDLPPADDE